MNSRKSMYMAHPSAFGASTLKPSKTPPLFSESRSTYCAESQVRVPLRPKTIRRKLTDGLHLCSITQYRFPSSFSHAIFCSRVQRRTDKSSPGVGQTLGEVCDQAIRLRERGSACE